MTLGVIIHVMRRYKTWVHMVAMLALLIGLIPSSAIASLFATDCKMVCCAGKPVHEMAVPACLKGCETLKENPSKSSSMVSEKGSEDCKCSIGSLPSTPQPDVVAPATSGPQIHQVIADIPTEKEFVVIAFEPDLAPGIFGMDSGPPASRPHYVSLGRAPPVLLA